MKKIAVIGGGYSGLSIAALLAKSGALVHLYEKHSSLGGCAGYFLRKNLPFDVGATTVSGLKDSGPTRQIVEKLGLDINFFKEEHGISFICDCGRLNLSSDINKTKKSFKEIFPDFPADEFWNEILALNSKIEKLLPEIFYLQFLNYQNISKLVLTKLSVKLALIPFLTTSFYDKFLKKYKCSKKLEKVFDEILMISTQGKARNVPALFAVLGLMYPIDVWSIEGGMHSLVVSLGNSIIANSGQVFLSEEIMKIQKNKEKALIKTSKRCEEYDYLVSAIPIFNFIDLLEDNLKKNLSLCSRDSLERWSAVTGYYTIETEKKIEGSFFQKHIEGLKFSGSSSIFISLSHSEDKVRTSGNKRTLTVSYHTPVEDWDEIKRDKEYKTIKNEIESMLSDIIFDVFKDEKIIELHNYGIGTPLTFERYTSRKKGALGGIAFDTKEPFFLHQRPLLKDGLFYLLSDTTIPGQSIYGLSMSSLNLLHYMKNARII